MCHITVASSTGASSHILSHNCIMIYGSTGGGQAATEGGPSPEFSGETVDNASFAVQQGNGGYLATVRRGDSGQRLANVYSGESRGL